MDEPVPSRLRAARRRGLTSPDPVTARHGPPGCPPAPAPSRRTGQAAEQVSGGTAAPRNTVQITTSRSWRNKATPEFTRWIEAKFRQERPGRYPVGLDYWILARTDFPAGIMAE